MKTEKIIAIRVAATAALGKLNNKSAAEDLQLIVQTEKNVKMIVAAIKSLYLLGERKAATLFIDMLNESDNVSIRTECAAGLGRIGGRAAIQPLVAVFKKEIYWLDRGMFPFYTVRETNKR